MGKAGLNGRPVRQSVHGRHQVVPAINLTHPPRLPLRLIVSRANSYEIKGVDHDYFEEE